MKKIKRTLRHLFHPHKSNRHRARLLHPEAVFVLFLLAASIFFALQLLQSVPAFGHVLGFASAISVEEVVAQTNQQRATAGLAPLTFNAELAAAARAKGEDMFAQQYWSHTSPAGIQPWAFITAAGYDYSVAGENLARDFSDTPSMINAWMNSPTHKANIVNTRYQEIGIAVINGQLEGYDTTLVVQMFGTERQQPAAVPPASISQTRLIPEAQAQEIEPTPAEAGQSGTPIPNEDVAEVPSLEANYIQLDLDHALPAFTPLMITKALFIGIAMLIMFTLLYDIAVVGKRHSLRVVGKNLAHFVFLGVVLYLIIFFKAGVIS